MYQVSWHVLQPSFTTPFHSLIRFLGKGQQTKELWVAINNSQQLCSVLTYLFRAMIALMYCIRYELRSFVSFALCLVRIKLLKFATCPSTLPSHFPVIYSLCFEIFLSYFYIAFLFSELSVTSADTV